MVPIESEEKSTRAHDAYRVPFHELLEIRPIAWAEGRGRIEMTVRAHHLRSLGIMHGGVAATLLDTVMGIAAGTMTPPDHYVVTAQLNVNFIRPAWEGEALVATSEVRHAGRQTAVVRGEIHTAAGALVASGSGTFFFVPHSDQTRGRIERHEDRPIAIADQE
ncbi:MAG: PaaI family thioesterase [Isosphaeraceae bacterium]|nr:PaaI family thioesterase [Isosphaeraceae bacterium]